VKVTIKITSNFKKEAKPLLKRYKSLVAELENLEAELNKNPTLGTPLGNNTFKIRIKISSKGKGKSGGARVISYLETELIANLEELETETIVNLISIYDKSETASISNRELQRLIANL